jgi:hypothetical protein
MGEKHLITARWEDIAQLLDVSRPSVNSEGIEAVVAQTFNCLPGLPPVRVQALHALHRSPSGFRNFACFNTTSSFMSFGVRSPIGMHRSAYQNRLNMNGRVSRRNPKEAPETLNDASDEAVWANRLTRAREQFKQSRTLFRPPSRLLRGQIQHKWMGLLRGEVAEWSKAPDC